MDEPLNCASLRPCAYRARAWWGRTLLAETTAAVRMDAPGRPPRLWFPWVDVRAAALRPAGREPWGGGEVERFDAAVPGGERSEPVSWFGAEGAGHAGGGAVIARRCLSVPPGLDPLHDRVTFDHDRARVELVDEVPGDDPRDVTLKRFPTWGDATDLVAVLEGGSALADQRRPVVEGGHLLGQAIVAAMREVPDRRVVSAHMAFLRAADAAAPVDVRLEPLTSGRSFSAFAARAEQGERLKAAGTLLLGVPASDVVRHADPSEGVPGPYESVPYDMGVMGRDLRVAGAAYTDDADAAAGPPTIDAWVRFRDIPEEPAVHAGLLAQFTGHMSIAAALRPHAGVGQREAHRTISTAVNAIAISFHAGVRMDRWVLYRHHATVVADGMSHSECRAYAEAGDLLASFTVDSMIRPFDATAPGARTAL